jgi:KaiC
MTDRLSSGQPRLDAILGGGLPADAINLIAGPPGSSKTILAEQYLFHNATEHRHRPRRGAEIERRLLTRKGQADIVSGPHRPYGSAVPGSWTAPEPKAGVVGSPSWDWKYCDHGAPLGAQNAG